MAKLIEFYVPENFQKPLSWGPQVEWGKVIEFCSREEKLSPPGSGFRVDSGEGK